MKNTVGLGGKKARSEQFIRDEHSALLRDKVRIRGRRLRVFHKFLNTKSLKLDPTIIDPLLRTSAPLNLKVLMLQAEVIETLLCGCVT